MRSRMLTFILLGIFLLPGCSYIQKARRTDELELENANLRYKIAQLKKEKVEAVEQVAEEKNKELSGLEQAKLDLEKSLKKEIGEYKARLKMTERGLIITFLSEVFFDSGKDTVKEDGKLSLHKVADVLNKGALNSNVAIEGHTDNDQIKYSAWASNWELSSARALAVLHYVIDECKIAPQRLSANGYGEFRPIVPNDSSENKQKNRRVEIIILPSLVSKIKAD